MISNREKAQRKRLRIAQLSQQPRVLTISELEKQRLRDKKIMHKREAQLARDNKSTQINYRSCFVPNDRIAVNNITAIIVNRRTLELTRTCIESLLFYYPSMRFVLVDNNSQDESTEYIRQLESDNIVCLFNTSATIEPHHALGINMGIEKVETDFFLTLDSDVTVLKRGWLEAMLRLFLNDKRMFGAGNVILNYNDDCTRGTYEDEFIVYNFVHPFCALWDVNKYRLLNTSFCLSGQPACAPCTAAQAAGYHLGSVPGIDVYNRPEPYYVHHKWGGTRDTLAIQADMERRRNAKSL